MVVDERLQRLVPILEYYSAALIVLKRLETQSSCCAGSFSLRWRSWVHICCREQGRPRIFYSLTTVAPTEGVYKCWQPCCHISGWSSWLVSYFFLQATFSLVAPKGQLTKHSCHRVKYKPEWYPPVCPRNVVRKCTISWWVSTAFSIISVPLFLSSCRTYYSHLLRKTLLVRRIHHDLSSLLGSLRCIRHALLSVCDRTLYVSSARTMMACFKPALHCDRQVWMQCIEIRSIYSFLTTMFAYILVQLVTWSPKWRRNPR